MGSWPWLPQSSVAWSVLLVLWLGMPQGYREAKHNSDATRDEVQRFNAIDMSLSPEFHFETDSGQQFACGVIREEVFCGNCCRNSAQNFAKLSSIRLIALGKSVEILLKVCGDVAEQFRQIPAMTPAQATPEVHC